MQIDKSLGKGYWNVDDSTYLDDLSYHLFCKNQQKKNYNIVNQAFFRYYKNFFPYNKHYKKAEMIIRKEKIIDINERIQRKN